MQTLGFVRVKKEVGKGIRERERTVSKLIVKSAVLVLKKYVKL